MASIWFITGTDTGVGKTVVSTALTAGLRAAGHRVLGLKPLETGCEPGDSGLVGDDARRLAEAAGQPPAFTGLYRFLEPLAPSVAARRAGEAIDLDHVVRWVRDRAREVDHLVVEGVGGLMVPLTARETVLDLIARIAPDGVIVVSMNRLGVLSQVLTATRLLELAGLPLKGVVLNEAVAVAGPDGEPGLAERTNREELERWVGPVVPLPKLDPDRSPAAQGLRLVRALGILERDAAG